MPACPDCGLVFDSLYNVQLHRRSGSCSQSLLPPLEKPVSTFSRETMYGCGSGYTGPSADLLNGVGGGNAGGAFPGRGYQLMAASPPAAANNPYASPTERELEQLLAYQRNRQAADMAERERLMLDQQVNLVLPARQAELQQHQQMLKSQLLQMKLQLFANQQSQEQGANMDMAYLRNEMAAMRGAVAALSAQQPAGAEKPRRRRQQRKAPRRALTAHSVGNRRSAGANDFTQRPPRPDTYGGEGRRAHSSRHVDRNTGRYGQDDDDDDYDESWSSLDDELRSDDSDGGDGVSPRSRRADRSDGSFASSPSQQIRGMLQDVQKELKTLRAMTTSARQGMDAPFPISSTLEPGLHLLKLAALEGVDMSIPLDEVDVTVQAYYMSYAQDEYLLEPSVERTFPRRPPPLARCGAKALLFTVSPVEFIVHQPKEMVVFVLQLQYRGRLLWWATIFSRSRGTFTEGLRDSALDIAKALQSPQGLVPGANVSGFIEADNTDTLRRAESFLNQSIGSSAAMGFPSQPPLPPSLQQLPGLPPLSPPPQGLPLLPGMPGCEGPFLPPTADVNAMVLQPSKGPATRFVLPPPTGVSILEWQESLSKHLKKMQKRSPGPAAGNGAAAVKAATAAAAAANNRNKSSPKTASPQLQQQQLPKPSSPCKTTLLLSPESSSSSSSSDEEIIEEQPSGEEEENNDSTSGGSHDDSDGALSSSPKRASAAASNPTKHRVAHFAEQVEMSGPSPSQPVPQPDPATSTAESPQSQTAPESSAAAATVDAESPHSPPHQAHTPPPKRNSNSSAQSRGSSAGSSPPPPSEKPAVAASPPGPMEANMPHTSPRNSLTHATAPLPVASSKAQDPLSLSSGSQIAGKVPRDDMPLVERQRLRPILDAHGNLAVPPGYKINPSSPPCVNLDKFDAPAEPPVNPCVLLGLAKPADRPPASPKAPGHGPKGTTVDIFLDGMTGLPLDAVCTRLLVYVTDEIDPTSGKPMNPLHHPRIFMRKPDLVVFQNLTSSSVEPQFAGKLSAEVGDRTFAVVIVEFISAAQDMTLVFGHCCLPINKRFFAGNYLCRVKMGDPRRSQERMVTDIRPAERVADEQRRATEKYNQMQLELSVDAQALHNLLPAPPRKRAECTTLGYLIWRLDSTNIKAPFFEMPQQLPMSQAELAVFEGRKQHKDTTPAAKGLSTLKAADNAFLDAGATPNDALGRVVPFSKERGAFVKVEGIRGVGDDVAMYVVVVYMPKAPPGRQVCYTMMPDWLSDVGAPMYKDAPFIFTGITYDTTNTVMFMLLKLTNLAVSAEGPARVEPLAWSMNKLFLEPANTIRQGRFALPWIAGGLPPSVVNELLTQRIEAVYMRMLKGGEVNFLTPHATLIISQGDSACISALVDESPGRGQPRQLLIPATLKKSYPTVTCEGMVGCTLRRAHERCLGGGDPRAVLQRINAAVQEYLKKTMPTFQEM